MAFALRFYNAYIAKERAENASRNAVGDDAQNDADRTHALALQEWRDVEELAEMRTDDIDDGFELPIVKRWQDQYIKRVKDSVTHLVNKALRESLG